MQSKNFKNSETGEPITQEHVSAQLQRLGINPNKSNEQNETQEAINDYSENIESSDEHFNNEGDDGEKKEEKREKEKREFTDIEKDALAEGWRPEGEKSAEEFLRAKPLYNELKARGKEIKELRSTIEQLKKMVDSDREMTHKKALNELKNQKREAIRLGDVESVEAIEEQERQHQSFFKPEDTRQKEFDVAAEDFKTRNIDWLSDPSYEAQQIREFMLERDKQLTSFNLDPKKHIEIIENDLKKKFSNYFQKGDLEEKNVLGVVESDSNRLNKTKRRPSFSDLTQEQKRMARYMEKHANMKIETYIEKLVQIGAL